VEKDIHTSTYKSYHTTTPNGFDLQISNHITEQNILLGAIARSSQFRGI
jgi:hypothetical protein